MILELGAGQGQDSRFFARNGYEVVSTDNESSALELCKSKLTEDIVSRITFEKLDTSQPLPYDSLSFDVVYAHLSLHYFDYETTWSIVKEIGRVLKPGGILAFLVNSTNDPEYATGQKLEEDYYQISDNRKRYFNVDSAREFVKYFDINLLDNLGETYKDSDKGIHNLIRFIGKKPGSVDFNMSIPFCAAIIEQGEGVDKEVLVQTRWQPGYDTEYTGTIEFTAGALDKPFEDIHTALAREIKEETGLTLDLITDDRHTQVITTDKNDAVIGFQPFCGLQQLKNGKPWVGFVFICTVKPGTPVDQADETKDVRWIKVSELHDIYVNSPEKLFSLELPAWQYYFDKA